ncbi:hypothetical protein [Virgibacillus ihumii]|uniref:hypothetical protein n=1 Tax=Virgibacillus ihumii TaxID=2686091 RepID=UPI00157BC37F|nr:hypothetical protein [Virgibacillus ihumii]
MVKDMFWDNSARALLIGLLETYGKDYLEKEMPFPENVQQGILGTAKHHVEERMGVKHFVEGKTGDYPYETKCL